MTRLLKAFLLLAVAVFTGAGVQAAPAIFFGEDLGLGESTRLPSHPNSDAARANFFSNLSGVSTENFEGFATGSTAPLIATFGSSTATLAGNGAIREVVSGTNGFGRYPISGTKYWDANDVFSMTFSSPQAAFGFYGVDIGDFSGQVTVTYANGTSQTITIPHTVDGLGGSVIYFGFIDTANPFTSITFGNTAPGTDVFAFDDFTIGTAQQVVSRQVEAVPTLSEWARLMMSLLLGLTALYFIRRKRGE